MILRGAQADGFFRKPPADLAAALVYGTDAMRVSLKRQDLIRNFAGAEAEQDMRLTRMEAGAARSDPASVIDALKAVGFFPGPRVVFVDGATDQHAAPLVAALDAWAPGDAALIVAGGNLKKTSKLRKAFEADPKAVAIGLYDDPMTRAEIDAAIAAEGLRLTDEARRDVESLATRLDPGDFRQTLTKIALYAGQEVADGDAVALMSPTSHETATDDVIHAAADGDHGAIGPLMSRLAAQGTSPVTLAIFATRHFQQLHGLAAGTGQAWGPRRDAMQRQARAWGATRLEGALALLMETDLTLRSSSAAPQMAVIERALIRLSRMAGAR
ncbi:DNA polymerase III subunit delta [Jannaschia aquimarina]|uniref:DNA-directed DNA polymerase n=1 Tax=Jannaschia aquimarina TaxID=935700 RepID=A0A0D1CPN3_9RHOB|nr:hypothetical protein [Jannaschia aquimarina]KIT16722.1 DNA polymerase III subunit delta [Jannaschia aquimarina]SNS54167.1 DNA polymerase III, delta subunit [Jannaschia aquimarina]